jgi:hypothetical protein
MIHASCCGTTFNCLQIYQALGWSIDGSCPWCTYPDSRLTDNQIHAVCTFLDVGWHAPQLRDPGPAIISSQENPFTPIYCSTEVLPSLRCLKDVGTGVAIWERHFILPRNQPINEIAAEPLPNAKGKKDLWLTCRCNNCG